MDEDSSLEFIGVTIAIVVILFGIAMMFVTSGGQ